MTESTEAARRALLPTMPAELEVRVAAGERVWDTEAMRAEFEAIGFQAPFIVVRRRSDGAKGSLMFTHQPRWYFGWEATS